MKCLFLINLLISLSVSLNNIDPDLRMETSDSVHGGINLSSMLLYFGLAPQKLIQESGFTFQFGMSEVIIGNSGKVDFGVQCGDGAEDAETTCEYDSVESLMDILWNFISGI